MQPQPRPNTPLNHPSGAEAQTGDWGTADTHAPSSLPTIGEKKKEAAPAATDFGPYELLGEVARGGMGVVYKAKQRGLDRVVALKMVLASQLGQGSTAERFIQEARAAAALDHPNIVPIYDTGEINGQVYFTMAYVDGTDLKGHVLANGPLPVSEIVSLFAQVVAGVAHAHAHGIIHRDLKPANVLLDKGGRPRVTDFGLAKRTTSDTQLTGTGQVMGTPAYMPPEQAKGAKDVGPAADVYALGGILYYLLTGRPPFDGASVAELLVKLVTEDPEPPRARNPEVPAELEEICLLCLSKNPADRFPDAGVLFEALHPIVDQYAPRGSASRLTGIGSRSASRMLPDGLEAATMTKVEKSEEAEAAPRRRNLIPVLGVIAAALLIVAVVVAVKPWGGKPPVNVPVPPDAGAGAVAAADPTAWPAPAAGDFGLKVELLGGKANDQGVLEIPNGEPLKITLTADRDCSAAVWVIDADGGVTQLFPNDDDKNAELKKDTPRAIPGNNKYTLNATPTQGAGVDRIRVVATGGKLPAFPPAGGKVGTVYASFTSEKDREHLASAVRGIVIKKAAPEVAAADAKVAQAELKFRVNK